MNYDKIDEKYIDLHKEGYIDERSPNLQSLLRDWALSHFEEVVKEKRMLPTENFIATYLINEKMYEVILTDVIWNSRGNVHAVCIFSKPDITINIK